MSIANNTFYYQHDDRTPVTKLSIVFRGAGEQKETEETAGLANIVAKMLFRGTTKFTRNELELRFDLLGTSISATASETDFIVHISAFTRNLPVVLDLVFHILAEADFPESEIQIVKKQEQGRLQSSLQNNEDVLRYSHRYILFNKTRLGKIGSASALGNINRNVIREYYKKVLTSEIIYLTVVSDLTEEKIVESAGQFIKNRPQTGFRLGSEQLYRKPKGREVFIVESPNSPNDRLLWSHDGISGDDPRRFALSIIIDTLGSFEGYLFDELRNKNGWCYGISSFLFPPTERKSLIGYYSDPSNVTSAFLIPKLLELLETFSGSADYKQRLFERNASFKNRFAYQQDINYKIHSRINKDKYGIPILEREAYEAEIDAVTESVALQTIKEVFDIQNMTMTFYGDSKRIAALISYIDSSIPITIFDKSELIA